MRKFPLFDGTYIDFDRNLDSYGKPEAEDSVVLHEDFAEEELPSWLSYVTDNGPASPTFNGLATSGGETEVTLSTGTTSSGDVTALQGPTINYSNWTEVRFYVYGITVPSDDADKMTLDVHLSDNKEPSQSSESFDLPLNELAAYPKVWTGGQIGLEAPNELVDSTAEHTLGFRIVNNDRGSGRGCFFVIDAMPSDQIHEEQAFPNATDLTFYASIRTEDTAADRSMSIDGMFIELVP